MKINIKDGKLTIELPVVEGRKSKSGKSYLLASTGGNVEPVGLIHDGRQVTVGVNCYCPVAENNMPI